MSEIVTETNGILNQISEASGLSIFVICLIGIALAFILFKITKSIISIVISLVVTLLVAVIFLNLGLL